MLRPDPAGSPLAVRRARRLLLALFGLTGLMIASWLARVPAVRDELDLSTADLGVVLLVGSLGSLAAVTASGAVMARWGSRRTLVASTGVIAVGYALMGVGPSLGLRVLLVVGVCAHGVGIALSNVAISVESGRVERAMGRTVIPQFHAAFSLGAVAGSALGALASARGVGVGAQLATVAVVGAACRLACVRGGVVLPARAEPAPAPVPAQARDGLGRRRTTTAWTEPRTLLLGVVVLAAALSEGSANTWLSLAVVDGFDRPEAVGGTLLGLFVAAMTAVRTAGTRLIDRYGRVATLRASGLVSLAGLALFGLAPTLPLAGVGVVAWGLGAALAVPIGIAAASDEPVRAAARVAVVSSFASAAGLAAPPLLGLAAGWLGARHALLFVGVPLLASVLVAAAARRPRAGEPVPGEPAVPTPVPHAERPVPPGPERPAVPTPRPGRGVAVPHALVHAGPTTQEQR